MFFRHLPIARFCGMQKRPESDQVKLSGIEAFLRAT